MSAIWLLTKKNIKLLIRAKWSALIVLFAPLLLILLLGLSYNTTNNFGINIGVYAPQFTGDVNAFNDLLREEEFTITEYTSSIEKCVQDIKSGQVHTCISLPENLQVQDNTQKEVTFYVDPSRINLVWMVQETVQSKFNLKAQEISQGLTQDILEKVSGTKAGLSARQGDVGSIKEKASSVTQNTGSIKEKLSVLDFAAPQTTYNLAITANLTSVLKEGKDKVEEAITAVQGAGLDENETAEIIATLQATKASLSETISSFNSPDGIGQLIITLQTDLEATKTKLAAAATAVSSSTETLTGSTTALSEMGATLDSLQAALNEMSSSLETLKVTNAGTISNPLITKIEKVSGERTYLNYLFPALLVLVIMFSSLLLGTTLVMIEKHSPAFLRNFFVPVSKITFVLATYLTNLFLIIIQIIVILGISLFFLKDTISSTLPVALILFIAASVFTFIGMIIGYLFTSEETGVLASISLGSILLLFSGVILPLEAVPAAVRAIAAYNPFVLAEKLVREIFLFNTPLGDTIVDVGILAGYALVLFLVILIMESLLHKHLVRKFMHRHHLYHRHREKRLKNI